MWGLVLLCVVLASVVAFAANGLQGYGVAWAGEVCSNAAGACDHPEAAAATATVAAIAYYALKYRTA